MPINKVSGKKDGKQKYRVRVNYQDAYGNYKQIERTCYGADEAKQLEMELANKIKAEGKASESSKKITLHQLAEEYLSAKQGEVRETTIFKNIDLMNNHIFPFFDAVNKNIPLDKLDAPILQKWKNYVKNKNMSLKMNQNIFGVFRAVLNYAVAMEYLQKNPLPRVGNFKDSAAMKSEMDYYTAEEFKQYISVARSAAEAAERSGNYSEWCYYTFFMIAFFTGARKGEINALQWQDISDDGYLSIKKSVAQKLKGDDRITPPKNKSSIRTIQMPEQLVSALAEQKKRQQEIIENFSDEIFVCGGYRPLRDSSIDNKNRLYAEQAGLKRIRIHDFRHSHVSLLANSGINIQEVARRLGHAKVDMTWNTYSHLYPKEEERATEVLNQINL